MATNKNSYSTITYTTEISTQVSESNTINHMALSMKYALINVYIIVNT
jgi:hypothetical protein